MNRNISDSYDYNSIAQSTVSEAQGFATATTYKGNWNWFEDKSGKKLSDFDDLFKYAGKTLGIDWKLVATHAYIESRWKADAQSGSSSAGGLFQFINSTWKSHAPKDYTDYVNKKKPEIATEAYIHLMTKLLNKFSNASTRNDQILLAFQSYHDGTISGTTWANVNGNKYTYSKEGRKYVPTIMKYYAKHGGQIS